MTPSHSITDRRRKEAKALAALLLAAVIWGFAFVAQRAGMRFIGPFTFNGIRFALGSMVLLPWLLARRRRHRLDPRAAVSGRAWIGVIAAGIVLFVASNLQQVGLVYTTAGKAGFITGLYVVIVPLLGLIWRQRVHPMVWIGCFFATVGLYVLSVVGSFTLLPGDALVLGSAFGWAVHVQLVAWLIRRIHPLRLAVLQFLLCAALSLLVASFRESIPLVALQHAAWTLAYAGILSVGAAYTLQLIGQQHVLPAQAGVVMSLETVFALLGGWWLLGESLSARGVWGSSLMLAGMMMAQLHGLKGDRSAHPGHPESRSRSRTKG